MYLFLRNFSDVSNSTSTMPNKMQEMKKKNYIFTNWSLLLVTNQLQRWLLKSIMSVYSWSLRRKLLISPIKYHFPWSTTALPYLECLTCVIGSSPLLKEKFPSSNSYYSISKFLGKQTFANNFKPTLLLSNQRANSDLHSFAFLSSNTLYSRNLVE